MKPVNAPVHFFKPVGTPEQAVLFGATCEWLNVASEDPADGIYALLRAGATCALQYAPAVFDRAVANAASNVASCNDEPAPYQERLSFKPGGVRCPPPWAEEIDKALTAAQADGDDGVLLDMAMQCFWLAAMIWFGPIWRAPCPEARRELGRLFDLANGEVARALGGQQ